MGKEYSHISADDRIKLYGLLYDGFTVRAIAKALNKHHSTIYRELNRNCHKEGYRPDWANDEYKYRRRNGSSTKLDNNPKLKDQIITLLKEGLSPELIAGRLKLEQGSQVISFETIYRYIYSPAGKVLELYKLLKKKRRFRYPRGKRRSHAKEAKPSIHERAETINNRSCFGHWEGDLVIFSKIRTNLVTLRERQSRYIQAFKNEDRKSLTTLNTLVKYMKDASMRSLTLDNGPEFARYKMLGKQLNAAIYFCDPYKSYQKGGVENANRALRADLPRQTDLSNYTQEQIDGIVYKLNNRPMKCLGFKTPQEVYNENCSTNRATI
jgi:transposase, IS30 family